METLPQPTHMCGIAVINNRISQLTAETGTLRSGGHRIIWYLVGNVSRSQRAHSQCPSMVGCQGVLQGLQH